VTSPTSVERFRREAGETPFKGDGMQQMLTKQVAEAPDVRDRC